MLKFVSVSLCCAMVLSLLAGCSRGPTAYQVSGVVMYDGKMVEKGEISFIPSSGGAAEGGTIENGKFSFRAQPGQKRVEIRGSRALPTNRQPDLEMGLAYEDFIPAAYNRESKLTAEVSAAGSHEYTFKLTPP